MSDSKSTTIIIGLGEIGKPLFNLIAKAENEKTIGIDIQPIEISESVGIMHICIPFQLENGFVKTVTEYAKKYKPEIIVVNSTVTAGTSESIEKSSSIPTVYSPVRGKHTRMEKELLNYTKFIAGNDQDALKKVDEHFTHVGMKTKIISNPRTLELSKLLETTYFGLLVSWAQEMDRFAKQVGGEYSEVITFFEEILYLPPVMFQPGYIGGHCIMSNIKLLKSQLTSEFLDTIEHSNEKKATELSGDEGKLKQRIEPIKIDRL
jgi:UDP-N-acetyl-D-mannosaminuronate dehydrogenase